jgi:transcriptional regulator with XRE-family HTH domain
VLGVPRRRYDDEALRARALELRAKGLSYREIARELGCSVFKVYQLISPYESPKSRIRQVVELAGRVEELSRRLRDLEGLASRLEAAVKPPVFNIGPDLELLCRNVMEARMTYRPCIHMDPDGYCTRHFVIGRVEGLDCRKGVVRGVRDVEVCYPSVLTHWFFCLLCPDYMPAEGEEAERILGDRWVECVDGRLVLVGPEESNP